MLQTAPDLTPAAGDTLRQALRALRPHRFDGYSKVRVGRPNDGGYVMLDAFDGITTAYSLGISNDVSWDLAMASRGIEVFQYDHTIDRLPQEHALFNWRKLGISPVKNVELSFDTLPNLIRENGHTSNRNMILKCDIEGMEWTTIDGMPIDTLAQFSQILLEIHGWEHFANPNRAPQFLRVIEKLGERHRLIHVHANNYAPVAVVGGIPIPDVLEISLVRTDLASSYPSHEMFPGVLDQPCNPRAADLFLGQFVFE